MTWIIVKRPIHYRRPQRNQSFAIYPSARPQLVVHDFAAHIVAQQAGQIVMPPGRGSAPTGPGGIASVIRSNTSKRG